jgi:hypothetical protein
MNHGRTSYSEHEILAWGDCATSCRYSRLTSTLRYKLAEAIYQNYEGYAGRKLADTDPGSYQSNRKAAIHLNSKLAAFDLKIYQHEEDEEISSANYQIPNIQAFISQKPRVRDVAIEIEHHRYLAERTLQDWEFGKKQSPENRKREGIIDWARAGNGDRKTNSEQHDKIIGRLDALLGETSTIIERCKQVNPDGILLNDFVRRLKPAKQLQLLWARKVSATERVDSESKVQIANPGDYICRGSNGDFVQSEELLLGSYKASKTMDENKKFEQYDLRSDATMVEAAQMHEPFYVIRNLIRLKGNPGDYVVQSQKDPSDIWIADRWTFEKSYHFQSE